MAGVEVAEGDQSTAMFLPGGGYHQCWYPVAFSEDVPAGTSVGLEFCDDRIVLYRGADGVARASIPYCKHMGADLSIGDVVGNDLLPSLAVRAGRGMHENPFGRPHPTLGESYDPSYRGKTGDDLGISRNNTSLPAARSRRVG